MDKNSLQAFERVFPKRDLVRGRAILVPVFGGLSAVLLVLLMIDLFVLVDLLTTRGEFAAADLPAVESLVPGDVANPNDTGVLSAVWWSRNRPWGWALAAAYRRVPSLRTTRNALPILVVIALGMALLRFWLLSQSRAAARQVASDTVLRLRRMLHRQTLRLSSADLTDRESGTVHQIFTEDLEHIRAGIARWVSTLGQYPPQLALLLALALCVDWFATAQCLVPLMLCWYLVRRERQRSVAGEQAIRSARERELKMLAEGLRKARLVRGYGMERFEHEQFQHHLERYRKQSTELEGRRRSPLNLAWMLVLTTAALVLYIVAVKVLQPPGSPTWLPFSAGALLVGAFVAIIKPLDETLEIGKGLDPSSEAAERVFRYLNRIPEVGQAVGAKFLEPLSKSLRFDDVTYALPGRRKLLDGFDVSISAGETVALISLDPLEARAAAYLLPRFIEPHSGRVLVDGEDIAWVTLESLRAEAIFVGSNDPFFSGSVQENIACGNPKIALQDVTEAAKASHAHNFVLKLPQGYETPLGERGEQLDAGQRFRLGLARALARKPALMIVEEPDEVLDDNTKQLLDDAYNRMIRERTVLFLPGRLSTVKRADRIVMIHGGKVVAAGKHADVLKSSPIYRHWEYVRFNEFRHDGTAARG